MRVFRCVLMIWLVAFAATPAFAFGDQGHKIVALIADHYLDPLVRAKIQEILARDSTSLTPDTGIASEATWADKYRDSDRYTTKVRYLQTRKWHFVGIEIGRPDIDAACNHHPSPVLGVAASQADSDNCLINKIREFSTELAATTTTPEERLLALQFLLHFVGDVHQPLHASDDHDQGGNAKTVRATGGPRGKLHHFWDTTFVMKLGSNPRIVAQQIIVSVTPDQIKAWKRGDAVTWANQSFEASKLWVYRDLGTPDLTGTYVLSSGYVRNATQITSRQLARAGVRLAMVLNTTLR
jgi:hypothetical protein